MSIYRSIAIVAAILLFVSSMIYACIGDPDKWFSRLAVSLIICAILGNRKSEKES